VPRPLCIFGSGTGRSGGWLATNILSVHSEVMVFNERVHFFRFAYGRYDPLTLKNVERMLEHTRLRLSVRFGVALDVEPILNAVLEGGEVSYKACYRAIMEWLLGTTGKGIWGEYVPTQWRSIPDFLDMFPEGKAFQIYRDLRGVLASWGKMSFMPENLYLNIIFNWIDSVNHVRRFRETLPADRYLAIRFEDVHERPEETVHGLCRFLGLAFEPQLLEPEKWPALFDPRYVEANVSAHDGKRYYGFHRKLTETWRTALEPWETALAEFLARDQLEAMGYPCSGAYDAEALHRGLGVVRRQPFLLRNLQTLLATGEGTQALPNDPTDPRNWSAGDGYFDKFVDTPAYAEYLAGLSDIERRIEGKYASGDGGRRRGRPRVLLG
jgi:hypothetical protein